MIDVRTALQSNGVTTKDRGTNVGRDFVNIDCPFCLETRKHCGIHMQELWFKCFVCGKSGGWRTLVSKLKQAYPGQQWPHVSGINSGYFLDDKPPERNRHYPDLLAPLTTKHKDWLTGYSAKSGTYRPRSLPVEILDEIKVYSGKNKLRGYVVFREGKNIIARKCTSRIGEDKPKWYKEVPEPPFIYGYQACVQECPSVGVITEGVFDCLRFPYGTAVAVLTAIVSDRMLPKICEAFEHAEKIIIALDRGVNRGNINKVVLYLQDVGYEVDVLDWDTIDPDMGKDVDDIAYENGSPFLHKLVGFEQSHDGLSLI